MKYYLILIVNCFLLVVVLMFFADHAFIPYGNGEKLRNVILLLLFLTVIYNLIFIYLLKRNKPESGLVYKTAAVVKRGAVRFKNYVQPFKRELVIYTLIAIGLSVAGGLLMGMPGFLLLEMPARMGIFSPIAGDNAWPAAILLSIIFPFCLPAGVFLKHWLFKHEFTSFSFMGPLVTLIIGIPVLIAIAYAVFGK